MFLQLIKNALKNALHEATEEWAEEVGLPAAEVDQYRSRRLGLSRRYEDRADALAAAELGVEDEETPDAVPMLSAARLTTGPIEEQTSTDEIRPEAEAQEPDDEGLMEWVRQQREAQVSWTEVARLAAEQGHSVGEEALRCRYRRWTQKSGQADPS